MKKNSHTFFFFCMNFELCFGVWFYKQKRKTIYFFCPPRDSQESSQSSVIMQTIITCFLVLLLASLSPSLLFANILYLYFDICNPLLNYLISCKKHFWKFLGIKMSTQLVFILAHEKSSWEGIIFSRDTLNINCNKY